MASATATYQGDWKVESLSVDGVDVQLPQNHPILISLTGEPTPSSIGVKVANNMWGSIKVTGQGENSVGEPGALNVIIGPMMSTRMMPPPALRAFENAISKAMPSLTKMTLVKGNSLCMVGSSISSPELRASRYTK